MVVRVQYENPPINTNARHLEASVNISASGETVLVAAVALKKVKVHRIFFVVGAATNITFKDGAAGTALTGPIPMSASGGFTLDLSGDPWFTTTAGNAFVVSQDTSTQISGRVYYTQV